MATRLRTKSSVRAKAKKPKPRRRTAKLKKIHARLRLPTGKPKKTAKPAVAAKRRQTPTTGSTVVAPEAFELPPGTEPPKSGAATKPPDAVVGVSVPSEFLIHRGTAMASGTGMLLVVLALAIGTVGYLCRIFMPVTTHFLAWDFASSHVVVILGSFAFGVAMAFTLSLGRKRGQATLFGVN